MHRHAVVLKEVKKYEEALEIERRVRKTREELLGGKHPYTLKAEHNYAITL